jgi:hypothetical protein
VSEWTESELSDADARMGAGKRSDVKIGMHITADSDPARHVEQNGSS